MQNNKSSKFVKESIFGRQQVEALVKRQPERAFDCARKIPDGWYRCQAMTTIAAEGPDALRDIAFKQARAAAATGEDAYQRAAVLVGTLRAAITHERPDLASAILGDILRLAPTIEPAASRAFALYCLWRTTTAFGNSPMQQSVLGAVLAHCHPDRSWRAARLYRDIISTLAPSNRSRAERVIEAMPEGKARAKMIRGFKYLDI